MQPNETPIENRFGETVLEERRIQGISQKVLARELSERGLALDASAISRIEKGTRAIRLSEAALIADLLGFSLSDVEHPRDPQDDFARLQKGINTALLEAHAGAMLVATGIEEMFQLLNRQPQLLKLLEGESGPAPKNYSQYVKWVEARWLEKNWFATTLGVDYGSTVLRGAVLSLIRTVVSTVIDEERHVKYQETL